MDSSESIQPVRKWFALYTKPRHEFKAADQLEAVSVEYYLPTITTLKQWSDRKKKVTEPLFRGYVFIHCIEKERLAALEQPAVVRTVNFDGRPAVIPDYQIENLRIMLEKKPDVYVTNQIKVGEKVKVMDGPFAGIEGIVYEKDKKERMLAISIDLLQRSVLVHLPSESVTVDAK